MLNSSARESENYAAMRKRMVSTQLRNRGITNRRVLQAMSEVPREQFVGELYRHAAYADRALPIECDQTISQPYTVAFMCQAALLSEDDKVMEIGTGSGYGAAVLSRLCREVHTIERIPTLSNIAADRLERLGFENVHVHTANGSLGAPDEAPFDAIIVTAGANELPTPYVQQLAEHGRIVIPLGSSPRSQVMCRFAFNDENLVQENLGNFVFVPLIGNYGWH